MKFLTLINDFHKSLVAYEAGLDEAGLNKSSKTPPPSQRIEASQEKSEDLEKLFKSIFDLTCNNS